MSIWLPFKFLVLPAMTRPSTHQLSRQKRVPMLPKLAKSEPFQMKQPEVVSIYSGGLNKGLNRPAQGQGSNALTCSLAPPNRLIKRKEAPRFGAQFQELVPASRSQKPGTSHFWHLFSAQTPVVSPPASPLGAPPRRPSIIRAAQMAKIFWESALQQSPGLDQPGGGEPQRWRGFQRSRFKSTGKYGVLKSEVQGHGPGGKTWYSKPEGFLRCSLSELLKRLQNRQA